MALKVCFWWQEDGRRYWFLSVLFLCKSVSICLSSNEQETSNDGIEYTSSHSHFCPLGSFLMAVWFMVNLIVGCILSKFANNAWSSLVEPLNAVM